MGVAHAEYVERALDLVDQAAARGIQLRILGSLAYRLHCPANIALFEAMKRDLTDIDFAARGSQRKEIRTYLADRGFEIDRDLLISTEGKRYAFEEPSTGLIVDVFFDELYFCHPIPLADRLSLDSPTITPTDLLLEKMQIVEINPKDIKDSLVLLLEHPLQVGERDAIDHHYVAGILADDWGFYYTVSLNLARLGRELAGDSGLSPDQSEVVHTRIAELLEAIEAAPKSRKWKLRARVGPRKRWYQEVAEKGKTF
jgi:hypothetical protein